MTCEEKLKILMDACAKELATTPMNNSFEGNREDWDKDANGWRSQDYGVFWDESDSWIAIKKAFLKVECEK